MTKPKQVWCQTGIAENKRDRAEGCLRLASFSSRSVPSATLLARTPGVVKNKHLPSQFRLTSSQFRLTPCPFVSLSSHLTPFQARLTLVSLSSHSHPLSSQFRLSSGSLLSHFRVALWHTLQFRPTCVPLLSHLPGFVRPVVSLSFEHRLTRVSLSSQVRFTRVSVASQFRLSRVSGSVQSRLTRVSLASQFRLTFVSNLLGGFGTNAQAKRKWHESGTNLEQREPAEGRTPRRAQRAGTLQYGPSEGCRLKPR